MSPAPPPEPPALRTARAALAGRSPGVVWAPHAVRRARDATARLREQDGLRVLVHPARPFARNGQQA